MGPLSLLLALTVSAAPPAVLETAEVDGGWVILGLSTPTEYSVRSEGAQLVVDFEDAVVGSEMKSLWSARGIVRELFPASSTERGRPLASVTVRLDAPRSFLASWSGSELIIELRRPMPEGRWRAQLGSFLTQEEAAKLESELDPALGNVEIQRAEVGGEVRYRVLLGPFPERSAAAAALRRSGREGFLKFD